MSRRCESWKQKRLRKAANTFEKFGYPVRLNGEEMLFWFNGTLPEEKSRTVIFYEFGVTDVQKEKAERSSAKATSASTEPLSASEVILGDVLSRVKNKNVVNVEKVDNASADGRMSLPDAQAQGMFEDGKKVAGNAVITEPGVTHFSVVAHDLYKELHDAFRQVPAKDGGKVWARKTKAGTVFRVCQYPDVLNRIVPWNGNVITKAEVARKLLNKHHFSLHDVARLPHALWNPIAAFKESNNSLVVITDIRTKNEKGENKNALAVLELRVDGENAEITDVKTAYAADSLNKYKNLFEGKALRYADKARAQQWAKEEGSSIFQLLTTSLAEPGSEVMLKENMPDVNYNFPGGDRKNMPGNFSVTEAQAQGMFKDGVMQAGNAIITEPGVTHFSVAGLRARSAGANMEASYVDPADGKIH